MLLGLVYFAFSQKQYPLKKFNTELVSDISINKWISINFDEEVSNKPLIDVEYFGSIDNKNKIIEYKFEGEEDFILKIKWTSTSIQLIIKDLGNKVLKKKIINSFTQEFYNLKSISYLSE